MKPRLPRTLFGKLLFSYLLVALVSLAAVSLITSHLFANFIIQLKKRAAPTRAANSRNFTNLSCSFPERFSSIVR